MGGSKTSQEKCWINSNWWDREMEHIWGIEYFYNLERSVDITTQSNSKNKVRNPDKPATLPQNQIEAGPHEKLAKARQLNLQTRDSLQNLEERKNIHNPYLESELHYQQIVKSL